MRVCVFGSSSSATPKAYIDASWEVGKLIAQGGHECVNGGGKTGCMGAVTEGCKQHGGRVIGVIHECFVVDGAESTQVDEMIVASGDGLADRKKLLVDNSDCILVMPGGCGTWDELWETVAEVGLGFRQVPIVCVSVNSFYAPFRDMLRRAAQDGLVYKPPDQLLRFADTPAAALRAAEEMRAQFKDIGSGPGARKRTGAPTGAHKPREAARAFLAGMVLGAGAGALLAFRAARTPR